MIIQLAADLQDGAGRLLRASPSPPPLSRRSFSCCRCCCWWFVHLCTSSCSWKVAFPLPTRSCNEGRPRAAGEFLGGKKSSARCPPVRAVGRWLRFNDSRVNLLIFSLGSLASWFMQVVSDWSTTFFRFVSADDRWNQFRAAVNVQLSESVLSDEMKNRSEHKSRAGGVGQHNESRMNGRAVGAPSSSKWMNHPSIGRWKWSG